MTDLTLSGAAAGQTTSDAGTLSPFSGVGVTSSAASPYVTATVGLSSNANGSLSNLGIGNLSPDGTTYTVRGSRADVQTALRSLVFTPVTHEVPVGQAVTTGFTLTASDAAGSVTDARTTVVATAANTPPTVTDTSATQIPAGNSTLVAGGSLGPSDPSYSSFQPFLFTTVIDPDAGASETVAIMLSQNGAATDAVGALSGAGLTKTGAGTYSLLPGSSASESASLEALRFTPANPGAQSTLGVTLTVSDGVGLPVTANSTLGLAQNPGGTFVVTNSIETPTVYNDTLLTQAAHTYATTIDAVLGNGDLVYDRTFALPYSDPQVQASVAEAKSALSNAGATPGSPALSVSNLSARSSQTNAVETGRSTTPYNLASTTTYGPAFVGPNVSVPLPGDDNARGYFHVLAGQTDQNINNVVTTTIDRTVTTTSTDLLSQQYVIMGAGTPPFNTPPGIAGTQANQPDTAGVAISPFAAVTVTDPDAGQTETVTVSFTAANGSFSSAGFTGAGGGFTETFASAAAAQAALRAATFTPTAGQSGTTAFTVVISDGQATATDSTTSVVATSTSPAAPGGGGSGTPMTAPPSAGLLTEFQNLERALVGGVDALTLGSPISAAFQAEKSVAAQLDHGQLTLAQAETSIAHLVDGTTAVVVASYGFFTASTPTAAGLNYLVHSGANATDLNDAYYAKFSTENRYINFAVNLGTAAGAGASAFQANYGALSLADATSKAYAAVFGAPADGTKVSALLDTLVPDGLGGQETRAAYFAQYGGDGPSGLGTKAAIIGFLLSAAVHDGSGVYGAATEHYLAALAHGTAPPFGSELALSYGPVVSLVGSTPTPDPTVTG